ncbi:MAG: hypothetical protein EHM93_12230 [Bacteroidales bacterium]|nr:MAG: hypothetical protein EHM93_12230 [Bacteroidales bacterium]
MKNGKSIFRISAFIAVLILIINPIFANSNEVKDRFEKIYKVSESDKLIFDIYDSDLQINTWKSNEIKFTGEILISGGEKKDVDLLLNAFKNPIVSQDAGSININTRFSEGTTIILGFYKRTKLITGESVSISSFKATYAIWVPESIAFKLHSKYNSIKAGNLLGSIDFDLYNVELNMGDFGDKSNFSAKYSTVNAGKGKDVRFEIYDSKFNIDELNKVIVNSKYSKVTIKSVNLLVLESYDDTYTIDNLRGIDISAKYSTLNAKGNSNLGKFDLYDCNVQVEDFTKIEFDSKYSEFSANRVGTFTIRSSYNDTYDITEVNDFSCIDSKYNKIRLGTVQSSISLPSSYDSELIIQRVSSSFTSFKGDFKYGSVRLMIDPMLNYRLICTNTYGEINYPKERFKNKPLIYIEKDSKTQFETSTDPNAKCEINFTSYDMNFTIE